MSGIVAERRSWGQRISMAYFFFFKKENPFSECEKCRVGVGNLRKRDNTILLT